MLMSLIIFVHGHGITQISMFCSNIIRKISRGSEEDIWSREENVHLDMAESVFENLKYSFRTLFAWC